jgi:methylated-DNA-[protein]-cysteine S-methyltransferase
LKTIKAKVLVKKKTKTPAKAKKKTVSPRVKPSPQQACLFPTTIGDMAIAWKNEMVTGVFLPEASAKKLLARVRTKLRSPRLSWTESPPVFVGHMAASIRTHLRGEAQEFTLEHLSLGNKTKSPFLFKVYECSQKIPSGKVLTYRELAKEAGSPKAFRAVGQAMARNPFPIVIPCHRVVGTGKNAGGFSAHGGLETKARILGLEARPSNE